jgi:hypothetical protein
MGGEGKSGGGDADSDNKDGGSNAVVNEEDEEDDDEENEDEENGEKEEWEEVLGSFPRMFRCTSITARNHALDTTTTNLGRSCCIKDGRLAFVTWRNAPCQSLAVYCASGPIAELGIS